MLAASVTSFQSIASQKFPEVRSRSQLIEIRRYLLTYGLHRFREEMCAQQHFTSSDETAELVEAGNPFLLILSGKRQAEHGDLLVANGMELEATSFCVLRRLPQYGDIKETHYFLLSRHANQWQQFNALTLGILASRRIQDLMLLVQMKNVATEFARRVGIARLGLYFHCYPLNSIQSLHLHIIDLDTVGAEFAKESYKSLAYEDVYAVISSEAATISLPDPQRNSQFRERLNFRFPEGASLSVMHIPRDSEDVEEYLEKQTSN